MPHPIVEIDELVRLVIEELVKTSPRTTVSFALTCRSLEEPTLSSLWKRQNSITKLLKVLPQHTWIKVASQSPWIENTNNLVSWCDFPSVHNLYQSYLVPIPLGNQTRPFAEGLGQVATICILDARIIPRLG